MLAVIKDARREDRKWFADHLRDLAQRFEDGDICNVVIVGNDVSESGYFTSGDFDDRWRMVGAVEYAKLRMIEAD